MLATHQTVIKQTACPRTPSPPLSTYETPSKFADLTITAAKMAASNPPPLLGKFAHHGDFGGWDIYLMLASKSATSYGKASTNPTFKPPDVPSTVQQVTKQVKPTIEISLVADGEQYTLTETGFPTFETKFKAGEKVERSVLSAESKDVKALFEVLSPQTLVEKRLDESGNVDKPEHTIAYVAQGRELSELQVRYNFGGAGATRGFKRVA